MGNTMNLAYQARTAVGMYLETNCTQEHFAELIGVPVEKVQRWESQGWWREEPGACLLLKGIACDTEFMLVTLVGVRLRIDLGLDIPEDIALEIVQTLLKKNGPQMSGKTRFRILRIITRAQLAAEAREASGDGMKEDDACLF